MKNNTTPHKPVPKGWRLATKAELRNLPHAEPMCLLEDKSDSWSRVQYAKGGMVGEEWMTDNWYAVKDSKPTKKRGLRNVFVPASTIPDSGARTNFSTGAVRDAAVGKGLPSRIPPIALRRMAQRFEDGAIKYPDGESGPNWMQGIPLSRFYDAIVRHVLQAAEGKTDEDHLGAVLWNAGAWAWTEEQIDNGNFPAHLNDLPFHANGATMRFVAAMARK